MLNDVARTTNFKFIQCKLHLSLISYYFNSLCMNDEQRLLFGRSLALYFIPNNRWEITRGYFLDLNNKKLPWKPSQISLVTGYMATKSRAQWQHHSTGIVQTDANWRYATLFSNQATRFIFRLVWAINYRVLFHADIHYLITPNVFETTNKLLFSRKY